MNGNDPDKPSAGWILHDGSCGICRRWVPFWENARRRRGFGIAALQEDRVMEKLKLPRKRYWTTCACS